MDEYFIFSVDSNFEEFITMLWLLLNIYSGPPIGIPNILSWNLNPKILSIHVCIVINSLVNVVLDSTVFCYLLYIKLAPHSKIWHNLDEFFFLLCLKHVKHPQMLWFSPIYDIFLSLRVRKNCFISVSSCWKFDCITP